MRLSLYALSILLVGGILLAACQQQPVTKPGSQQMATGTTIEQKTDQFQVSVDIAQPPLETQTETFTVKVEDLHGQPAEAATFEVVMPMEGGSEMKAPTKVKKLDTPGTYQLQSEFTMPGEWTLQVKPTASSEAISVPLEVQ